MPTELRLPWTRDDDEILDADGRAIFEILEISSDDADKMLAIVNAHAGIALPGVPMQPKQPKAEKEKNVSQFGEPWHPAMDQYGWVVDRDNKEVHLMYERHRERAIACVNALAGIPNPEAVREVIEAARQLNDAMTDEAYAMADLRISNALEWLDGSAPSASPQQK